MMRPEPNTIYTGDALETLKTFAGESIHCCITSPPYWSMRDYGVQGQLGLESTVEEYTAKVTDVFREVRRVLRKEGTLWLSMGDCFASGGRTTWDLSSDNRAHNRMPGARLATPAGLKAKDLVGLPWRVAFALQEDGWWLRSDIIYSKPNPMPESVTDRPTKAHEYVFLLAKSERYYFDQEAAREPYVYGRDHHRNKDIPPDSHVPGAPMHSGLHRAGNNKKLGGTREDHRWNSVPTDHRGIDSGRNCRSVWTIPTSGFSGAHFATFPEELVRRCLVAGCPEGGIVLDPFMGSGTVGLVALKHNRKYVGIELNPAYVRMAEQRIHNGAGLLRGERNA